MATLLTLQLSKMPPTSLGDEIDAGKFIALTWIERQMSAFRVALAPPVVCL
jgi:hypothetical protein